MNDVVPLRLCLVSAPGLVRDATCVSIAIIPYVRLVALAEGALSATQQLPHAQADLVLLDANVPDAEVCAFLNWLGGSPHDARTVVARTTSYGCREALAFGADVSVRRDELGSHLCRFATELLRMNGHPGSTH